MSDINRTFALLLNSRLGLKLPLGKLEDMERLLDDIADKMYEHAIARAVADAKRKQVVTQFENLGAAVTPKEGAEATLAHLAAIGELLPETRKR